MKTTPNKSITSWLIGAPLRFSVFCTVFTLGLTILYGFLAKYISILRFVNPVDIFLFIGLISVICGAIFSAKKLNTQTLDKRSFVAITNATTVSGCLIMFISTMILSLSPSILIALQSLTAQGISASVLTTAVLLSIFFMYIIGLFAVAAYAKLRRAQTIGIPTWKIICSIPFGFGMTWIPGYFIEDKKSTTHVEIKSKWYNKLTDAIIAKPIAIALAFCITVAASGIFFGFSSVLLTFASAMLFSICTMYIKPNDFIKRIGKTYATWAVIINIVFIISLTISFAMAINHAHKTMHVNINDTVVEQQS